MHSWWRINEYARPLLTIFAIVLLISTSACGATAATQVPTDAPVVPTATTVPTAAPTIESGDFERTLTVDGLERMYQLHIPTGLDTLQPAPVVFVFHGAGGDIPGIQLITEFDAVAANNKFVLVYPLGVSSTWNAGTCCRYAAENNIDDIGFVQQILADVETLVPIDAKRIYATGFSNGAMLAYRLACEMSDVFAAVAPVGGILVHSPCEPQQPVSVLHVHGMEDLDVPFEGSSERGLRSIEEVISMWAELDGCTGSPTVDNPIRIIKHSVYSSCESDAAVELYAVEGGGHSWLSKYVYPISEVIWKFFAAHPKP